MEQDLSPRKHEILDRVNDSIKEAMIAKQSDRLLALRNIKTEIINEEKKTGQSLDDTAITTLFKAMVKSREKANEIFTEQARPDLTENNSVEISIMSEYLPKKMSQEETKYALEDVMKAGNLYSKSDMGAIMRAFGEKHPDGDRKLASQLVQSLLV